LSMPRPAWTQTYHHHHPRIITYHLQETLSVKTPPIKGPATLAIPYIAPMKPVNIGLFCNGTLYAIIISAPENIPAEPTPAIALPTIKVIEFGAAPQIALPTSKMKIAVK
jgi:hypothetical protein